MHHYNLDRTSNPRIDEHYEARITEVIRPDERDYFAPNLDLGRVAMNFTDKIDSSDWADLSEEKSSSSEE